MNEDEQQDFSLPAVNSDQPNSGDDNVADNSVVDENTQGVVQPTVNPSNSAVIDADDVDLIEKEWVDKAKSIVDETTGDPYAQNIALNKMKADYLKKRYDKDISTNE